MSAAIGGCAVTSATRRCGGSSRASTGSFGRPVVIIPFRGGCPHREAALGWVRARYGRSVLAEGSEPWVKAAAVMPAIRKSRAEVIAIVDADVWCPGFDEAVAAVQAGAPWAIPHGSVYRLSEGATADVLSGTEPSTDMELERRVYQGISGGGIVIAPRQTFLDVPMDHRFIGWGGEDFSHGIALRTMLGLPWRGTASLFHLYHPPQERRQQKFGSLETERLRRRYMAARKDPKAMRRLLNESRPTA